tara:strand:+ start:71 stop:244 length:174 start_codon:yes stop_codon:yes gene_type:complete
MIMSKMKKQIAVILSCSVMSLTSSAMPTSAGIYDMRPKNSFRGGSIGKGGKVKYRRG